MPLLPHLGDPHKAARHVFLHSCVLQHMQTASGLNPEMDATWRDILARAARGHRRDGRAEATATPIRITLGPRQPGDERNILVPGALLNLRVHRGLQQRVAPTVSPLMPTEIYNASAFSADRDVAVFLCVGLRGDGFPSGGAEQSMEVERSR